MLRSTSTHLSLPQIVPLLEPAPRIYLRISLQCMESMDPAFNWPRVLKDTHRIRVCLYADNARAELDALVDVAFG